MQQVLLTPADDGMLIGEQGAANGHGPVRRREPPWALLACGHVGVSFLREDFSLLSERPFSLLAPVPMESAARPVHPQNGAVGAKEAISGNSTLDAALAKARVSVYVLRQLGSRERTRFTGGTRSPALQSICRSVRHLSHVWTSPHLGCPRPPAPPFPLRSYQVGGGLVRVQLLVDKKSADRPVRVGIEVCKINKGAKDDRQKSPHQRVPSGAFCRARRMMLVGGPGRRAAKAPAGFLFPHTRSSVRFRTS